MAVRRKMRIVFLVFIVGSTFYLGLSYAESPVRTGTDRIQHAHETASSKPIVPPRDGVTVVVSDRRFQGLTNSAVMAFAPNGSLLYYTDKFSNYHDADQSPVGRRPPVVAGMFLAGAGVLGMVFVEGYLQWAVLAGVAGLGMALLYPNLMTVPGDACHPTWRATGMGVYRMWRDSGYGVGAILIGLAMQLANVETAFYVTGILMFVSGAIVYFWMEETHPNFGTHEPPTPARENSDRAVAED